MRSSYLIIFLIVIGLVGLIALSQSDDFWPLASRDREINRNISVVENGVEADSDFDMDASGVAPEFGAGPVAPNSIDSPVLFPTFDVVRISPGGNVVIAGRTAPGATVTVRNMDTVIGEVVADERGEWVLLPDQLLPPGSYELSLSSRLGSEDVVLSNEVVILYVPEQEEGKTLAVRTSDDGLGVSTVLQSVLSEQIGQFSVRTLDYDEKGSIVLSGSAMAGATVKVFLGDELLGIAESDISGNWTLELGESIAPGYHELRIEQTEAGGPITAELPLFFRYSKYPMQYMEEGHVIVQPGNSLWRIARATLGGGWRYTMIFEANAAQIADPNLIYPGQILAIPID